MNPIFIRENEHNLRGYWYYEFISSFDAICQEHIETNRANKFAFISYDFHSATHKVLEDRGIFTELDRISGKDISIFYLDAKSNGRSSFQNKIFENFNTILLELTGQHIRSIPFVVFFDFKDNEVSNFNSYRIRDDEKYILNDLSSSLVTELKKMKPIVTKGRQKASLASLIKSTMEETPKILCSEFIKQLFKGIVSN